MKTKSEAPAVAVKDTPAASVYAHLTNRQKADLIARDCALFVEAQEEIEISGVVGPSIGKRGVATMANLIFLALERPEEYPVVHLKPDSRS